MDEEEGNSTPQVSSFPLCGMLAVTVVPRAEEWGGGGRPPLTPQPSRP